ncbi:MAG: T9SS type A sorting domain-containing protein [bacterium]
MKKFYALLLSLLAVAWFAYAPAAQAQYTVADYAVSTVANSFATINGNGGTEITEITPQSAADYHAFSNSIFMPFNARYLSQFTNEIKVTQDGAVVVGGTGIVPDGVIQNNNIYGACLVQIFSTANFSFNTYGQFYFAQQNFGNPAYEVEFPNSTIHAWTGLHTANGSWNGYPAPNNTKFMYKTVGTAPYRSFIVETVNMGNYQQNCNGSWQIVLSEPTAFVSKVQINFGNRSNANSWYNNGDQIGTGLKDQGGNGGALSVSASPVTPPTAPQFSTTVQNTCYDNENYALPTIGYLFIIRYDYVLAFVNPQNSPADASILPISNGVNNPITPQIAITNEGKNAFNFILMRCIITRLGDPPATPIYNQTVSLTNAQFPAPLGGTSPIISFPTFFPQVYGLYTITYTVDLSAPVSQVAALLTSSFVVSPPNNVASVLLLQPQNNSRTPLNIPVPTQFRYRNLGANPQTGVPVSLYIKNPQGAVTYRDTVVLNNWASTTIRDTTFKDWTPTQNGIYSLCGMTLLATDALRADDTLCATPVFVRYESDVLAVSIFNPADQEEKPEKKSFKPGALFNNYGVRDLFDIPVRCIMTRCSDNQLVFRADTIMPELNVDAGNVKMFFPSKQGIYDIAALAPGCYNLCAIARQSDDGDRTNDTTCSFFAIIPRLKGDYNVGVGQQFQTISAAVDSMRFRGIGGNVNLILTDAAYSENGNTTVSTPNSAVEFRDIIGSGPQAIITWKPKKGVSPVITFTGTRPTCMSWAYKSANYMVWDGNNQFSPSADLLTPEPAKRGITFINNSSALNLFDIEFGRTNLTFKNLIIRSNGNLNNSGSVAISMPNVYTSSSYLAGVVDTAANQNITIDNCEIGNANTGILDVGTTPLFDQNLAVFLDKRNVGNRFTRNTIGTALSPIGSIGIKFGNELGLYIGHNEISNIFGGGLTYAAGISQSAGNSVNLWIDANRIHNIKATSAGTNTIAGIDIQQAATIYTVGSAGPTQKKSVLPVGTRNRITNNILYDFRYQAAPPTTTIQPITMTTGSTIYFTDNDSIFNNSVSVKDAPAAITVARVGSPFIWNNIIQDLNNSANATNVMYSLVVPRPWKTAINSDYNLFHFRENITAVNVTGGGAGYILPPTVVFTGGGGTGAAAVSTINPVTGAVNGIIITSPGTGYTSAPTVSFSTGGGPGAGATATAVYAGNLPFAIVSEYDRPTGTFIQTNTIKNLTEWRTYTGQDVHSVTGDPMFSPGTNDSLHMPAAATYTYSPASNNGAWLNTGTQQKDFDGDDRLVANNTPDIGADEFEGFQYTSDLSVQVITRPSGITDNAGVINVTTENPLQIQAIIKNQSLVKALGRNAYSKFEVSTDNGTTWNLYNAPFPSVSNDQISNLNFEVAESKTLDFRGPNITGEAGKLFRLTVYVDPDQNNSNNSLSLIFKTPVIKRAAVLLSYYDDGIGNQGRRNKDSLAAALQRLGVPYDSLDRLAAGTAPIDYTPWWTIVWSTGTPVTAYNTALSTNLGIGAISLKEEEEIIRYFNKGQTYAKKSFIVAGENIAKYNDPNSPFQVLNNALTDQELMANWFHTSFVARWPGLNWPIASPRQYRGLLNGVGAYFKFSDSILSVNSLTSSLSNVTIVTPGAGYLPGPLITLSGGGGTGATAVANLANGQIPSLNLTSNGANYTSAPTVTIAAPPVAAATAAATANVAGGQVTSFIVTTSGRGYFSAPNVFLNGGGGSGATAVATVDAAGQVTGLVLTNQGSGYTSAPTVMFDVPLPNKTATAVAAGPMLPLTPGAVTSLAVGVPTVTITGTGAGAIGIPTMLNGSITGITVANGGTGYTIAPTVTINAPSFGAIQAAASSAVYANGSVAGIVLTNRGQGYFTVPTVTITGTGTGATAVASVNLSGQISGVTVTNAGTGYTVAPTVTFSAPVANVTATATANLSGTAIGSFTMTNVGQGYFYNVGQGYMAQPAITFSGGGGTGATGLSQLTNGQLTGISMTSTGNNYTSAPTAMITPGVSASVQASATCTINGTGNVVSPIVVTAVGQGYFLAPTVTFSAPPAGTTAVGNATVNANGQVTGITVTNAGSGYLVAPTITLSAPTAASSASVAVGVTIGGGPNVIKVNPATGIAGDNISRVAYNYALHPSTPLDSGAATAWTGATFNMVFYAFDWSDPLQSVGFRDGEVFPNSVSGTTRFLRGALDFLQTFRGVYLPVEFEAVNGKAISSGNQINWTVAAQKNVDHYEIEMQNGNDWAWAGEAKASSASNYSFLHTAQAAFEVGRTFTYRIVAVDLDGAHTTSNSTTFGRTAEGVDFALDQNYPNPFNPSTMMTFTLPTNGTVSLRVLDMTGKVVATPINAVDYNAGKSQFKFEAANLASGTYVYELSFTNLNGETVSLAKKMTLNK